MVLLEDLHILEFVFFCAFEDVAVMAHEASLYFFEVLFKDDFLEGHEGIEEEEIVGGGGLVWI